MSKIEQEAKSVAQVVGTENSDLLVGTFGDDEMQGLGGNDLMIALSGDDTMDGGDGDDFMLGGAGYDVMSGGNGEDIMIGGSGDDTVIGNKGNDLMFGGSGDDLLVWNNGDGSDVMRGGSGDDTTQVNFFTDLVNFDLQNDDTARFDTAPGGVSFARTELNGQSVNGLFELNIKDVETIETNFGGGNDTAELVGDVLSAIAVKLDGGADDADTRKAKSQADADLGDTLDLSELGQGVRVDLDIKNQGVLQGPSEGSDATAPGLSEEGSIVSGDETAVVNDFENVIGTDFNDAIFGNAQNNVLIGGDGDDVLHPFAGDDFVDGGAGTDTLLLNGFPKGSVVNMRDGIAEFIDGTGGKNTFVNIENINGSSVAGDHITGDGKANVLNGLGGNDTLKGGAGNDHLIGGDNVDRARADAQGDNADVLNGGRGDDTLEGGLGNDVLRDGKGNDVVDAGDGDDRIIVSEGNDIITGGAGADRFIFNDEAGVNVILDFEIGVDVIRFRNSETITDAEVLFETYAEQVGNDVVIDDDTGTAVTLVNTSLSDLEASDFIF